MENDKQALFGGDEGDENDEIVEEEIHSTNAFKAAFTITCATAGVGVLGLPYAVKEGGWLALGGLVILGLMLLYTAMRMAKCLIEHPSIHSYPELGYAGLGRPGQIAVTVTQMANCVGSSIIFLVLAGENMNHIVPDVNIFGDKKMWILIAALVVLPPSYLKNLEETGWVAIVGALAVVYCVVTVFVMSFASSEVEKMREDVDYDLFRFTGIASAIASMCFAYGGHIIFPDIVRVMGPNRGKFYHSVLFSYIFFIVLYLIVSGLLYGLFGNQITDNILTFFPDSIPIKLAQAAIIVHVLFAFVIFMNPPFYLVEEILLSPLGRLLGRLGKREATTTVHDREGDYAQLHDEQHGKLLFVAFLARVIIRTVMVAGCAVVAYAVPFFGPLMSLIGGSAQAASILILPALIYVRMYWATVPKWEVAWVVLLVVVGLVVGVVASVLAVKDIVKDLE
mmetsp:Transcript_31970/g.80179  ORF Transcript_31970/g.80179 Transcript_31970/m.80179 type:complete len:451 (-) Transcript_31970:190-1542(-)